MYLGGRYPVPINSNPFVMFHPHPDPTQVILPPAPGVSNEGPRSRVLGALAGCFLALGSGLRLVGTASLRR